MVIRLTEEEERGVIAEARKEQERLGELSRVFAGEEFLKGMDESRLRKLVQTYVKAVELLYCEDKKRCRETLSFLKGEFNGILVPVPSYRVSRKFHKVPLHIPTWRAVYKVLKKKVEKEIPLRMPEKVSKEDAKVWTLKYFLFSFLDEREIRETLKKNGVDLEELEFLTRRVVESAKEKGVIEWGGAQKNLLKGSIFLLKRKAGVRFEPPPKFLTEVYYGYALNCPFGEKPVEKLYFAYLQELLELCRKDKDLERKVAGEIADIHLISINEGNFPQDTPVEELVNPIRLEEALEKANSDEKLENVYRIYKKMLPPLPNDPNWLFAAFLIANLHPEFSIVWEKNKEKCRQEIKGELQIFRKENKKLKDFVSYLSRLNDKISLKRLTQVSSGENPEIKRKEKRKLVL
jgi:hypothetical protein